MSINTTPTDYYILLDLNAGYGWSELTLMDMLSRIHVGDVNTEVVAYVTKLVDIVDGSEVEL